MNEKFLNYIWFNKLFYDEQQTLLGESVKIISTGIPNNDEGPDVFNAKVQIADKLWAGNVEFHVKASDWHRHGHDCNPQYTHIILHVVLEADEQIVTQNGAPIPTIVLSYPEFLRLNYERLVQAKSFCSVDFSKVAPIHIHQWVDRLLVERLQYKVERINDILKHNQNDWEQAFYVTLARAFGFGVNSDAMQSVAQSLPLNVVMHHRDRIEQIESLLLGQSGLLENIPLPDEYISLLQREYNFLRHKFSLHMADGLYFKFLRMRPNAFPSIRLVQFASLLHKCDNIFSRVIDNIDMKSIYSLFDIEASSYWKNHYKPNVLSEIHGTHLSKSSVDIITINAIVPFLFKYSEVSNDELLRDNALSLLRQIKPELNHKTMPFISHSFPCENAYDSQSLIQLYDNYCTTKNCLRCQIGHQYIKRFEG